MADGQQIWNFPGITASADGIRKATTMVAAEESQIKGNLTTLASIWVAPAPTPTKRCSCAGTPRARR